MFQFFLQIAGIRIRVKSRSRFVEEDPKNTKRYEGFIKENRRGGFDIDLEIEGVTELPVTNKKRILFEVRKKGLEDARADFAWIICQVGDKFLIESYQGEKYNAVFNSNFTKGKVYIKKVKGVSGWKITQLILGPLQIMIMHYLAIHKLGVLVHSSGIKHHKEGFLFVGPTRAGKSTSARLWQATGGVEVLNDDRIVVRRVGKELYMFGTPWHGDFSDYYETIASSAPLRKLFFIYHCSSNRVLPLKAIEAFQHFFPNTFPVFWDRGSMDFTADFLCEVLNHVPAFSLGFVKEQSAVEHVQRELGV